MKFRHFAVISALSLWSIPGLNAQAQDSPSPSEPGQLYIEQDERIDQLVEQYRRTDQIELKGYRVQLFNGSKSAADRVKARFVRKYPGIPIYLTYDSPEYRVQIGNFRDQMQAEKFLYRILDDFPGSFVVSTRIDFPELSAQ